jgi:hypothetical protein
MWGIQELTFTTEQNTAWCMCELCKRKPERRGKQQRQVPLSEYKRDEEFPLEKTLAPLTDYNRRLKPLSHRHGPNSPSLASRSEMPFRSHSAVGSLFEVLIHASQLYSLSLCTRVSYMTFHSFLRFCHLDLTRVFFGDVGQLASSSCCAVFALVVLVSLPIVAICFSRAKISNKSINTIIW